ncbi:hypothetical protein EJ05DRAFT_474838 [Pseudovirgaria hyperparasitica]|uniref:Aminoglycoside phosphotransferase domain-containing protein n=1 Tax=Pseudovirgaria hyperparasitica TaxID=470096 RepID=A0A6A6WD47_9PEZI|nr:uncharacterized protein EJ05DRAFT_474838 [Pseudovirgaria hyperparasitica]KAF2759776.1 hypothetical protein EJ05DRAFT_474838 [Pseudovirgaria hyperparasitica]
MVIEITSNADLPKCLNTPSKQSTKARQLVNLHSDIPSKKARGPNLQGFFSRTVIVTLQNGEDVVIQFRPEPLDLEPFLLARRVLGEVVPDIKVIQDAELEREGIWVYWMTCIPGKTWLDGARGRTSQTRVTTVRSLGRILSKGYVDDSSGSVIDHKVRPHLELLLASEDPQIRQFHLVARDLLGKLDQLKSLPLFVAHFDLNEVNIMVDDNCEVSGIVDWELSTPLPFGMGFGRVHTLAGEYSEQKFYMPPEFDDAERGFWQEIWDGIPENVRSHAKPEAVQIAVTLGTLLDTFQLDEGKVGPYSSVAVNALPKFLTYRIPLIRGPDSPPYSE